MNNLNRGTVFVKKVSPETILEDYSWLLQKAKVTENFDKSINTFLKVNISWDRYYPGCSTAPWQLEGVIKELLKNNFSNIIAAHNGTVVVDPERGRAENKHKNVEDKYNIPYIHSQIPLNQDIHPSHRPHSRHNPQDRNPY